MATSTAELLKIQTEHLHKLSQIVLQTIDEENSLISNHLHPPLEHVTWGQKVSDRVAKFGGSWLFICLFIGILLGWIIYNSTISTSVRFDPYPYILLNLILSCIAALQAPIIMMSQNRQEEKDRLNAENDYMINLKAELEVRSLHQKVDLLLEDQIKTLFQIQAQQIDLLNKINEQVVKLSIQVHKKHD
jgi:uncharacterized membrane protein